MSKRKIIAILAIFLAFAAAAAGYVSIVNAQQAKEENAKIAKELETIDDVTVKEGEVLPSLKDAFKKTTMIDKNSINANIQDVDVTTPGIYKITYTFFDINGEEREKTINCIVKVDLEKHVEGLDDIEIDCGEDIPEEKLSHDELVENIIRDTDAVKTDKAGTYPVKYTILGVDGEMAEVERTAIVKEVITSDSNKKAEVTDNDLDTTEETETPVVEAGNIENTSIRDNTVPTGDETNVAIWIIMMFCAAAVPAIWIGARKLNK